MYQLISYFGSVLGTASKTPQLHRHIFSLGIAPNKVQVLFFIDTEGSYLIGKNLLFFLKKVNKIS